MIDADDLTDFAIIFWPTTITGFSLWMMVLIILGFIVVGNMNECAAKTCPDGEPAQLLDNRCLCVKEVP